MAPIAYVLKQLPCELNSTLYLSILVGTISILLVLNLIITRKRNKSINLPPSPPKLPFIGNLHQLGTLTHRSFKELSNKHGPLMFLQLGQIPTLVVSSAKIAKEIVKNQDIIFSNRPQTTAANIFLYGCKDLGFMPYGEEWRQKRKVCVLELLSLKRVKSFLPIRDQEVVELVDTISKACSRDDESPSSFVINLSELMIATSNNIVSRCVLGQKYDIPDGSGHGSFGELGRKVMGQLTEFCVGDFFPTLGWIDVVRGLISEFNATFVELDSFLNGVIEEHKNNKKNDGEDDNKDFVDILLHLQDKGLLEFELTLEDLKAMLMDMFVGGSDTTSTNLEWIFTELLRNPNTMKKFQEEIRRIVGNKSKVDENDINEMKYLKCVIKEGLRLHPPVPILVPRQTTSNAKVKGYDIPSKTTVYYNVWAIHRDPELWENPEEFIPERFENIQIDYKGQDFQLLPFGTGRRGCPGISFGIASTEIILANLLYWFDWKLPTNENGELVQDIDMTEMSGITVSKKVPLHLHPIPFSL